MCHCEEERSSDVAISRYHLRFGTAAKYKLVIVC